MTSTARPTGPKGRPLIGHLGSVRADQLGFLHACARDYGDVVDLRYGPRPVVLLNHPTDIEAVLVGQNRSFVTWRFYSCSPTGCPHCATPPAPRPGSASAPPAPARSPPSTAASR